MKLKLTDCTFENFVDGLSSHTGLMVRDTIQLSSEMDYAAIGRLETPSSSMKVRLVAGGRYELWDTIGDEVVGKGDTQKLLESLLKLLGVPVESESKSESESESKKPSLAVAD